MFVREGLGGYRRSAWLPSQVRERLLLWTKLNLRERERQAPYSAELSARGLRTVLNRHHTWYELDRGVTRLRTWLTVAGRLRFLFLLSSAALLLVTFTRVQTNRPGWRGAIRRPCTYSHAGQLPPAVRLLLGGPESAGQGHDQHQPNQEAGRRGGMCHFDH